MSEQISDRHESDLGGRFLPFGDTNHARVTVVVPEAVAHECSVQHTAWMLLNLLSRQAGVVERIGLVCPTGVPLAGRIVPLAERSLELRNALLAGCQAIGIVPIEPDSIEGRTLAIGTQHVANADLYVNGSGWDGGISTSPIACPAIDSRLNIGPYIAACVAAGEIFKAARMRPEHYAAPPSVFYSGWSNEVSCSHVSLGPATFRTDVEFTLAGVGAVGSALLHTLWACDGLGGRLCIVDGDVRGLESTNLNRYALFDQRSVGRPKASEAMRIVADAGWTCESRDMPVEQITEFPRHIVSAVDRNHARAAIQNRYPAIIHSGSTQDLRAEVLRCGPPGVGACLRCFNPPESNVPDQVIRERVKTYSDKELATLAISTDTTLEEVREWTRTAKCGVAGDKVLAKMRDVAGETREFAVGFVSVMAAVMLAAEILKCQLPETSLEPHGPNRAVFQFWSPAAPVNKPSTLLRDPECPMCRPGTPALEIWSRRFAGN